VSTGPPWLGASGRHSTRTYLRMRQDARAGRRWAPLTST